MPKTLKRFGTLRAQCLRPSKGLEEAETCQVEVAREQLREAEETRVRNRAAVDEGLACSAEDSGYGGDVIKVKLMRIYNFGQWNGTCFACVYASYSCRT